MHRKLGENVKGALTFYRKRALLSQIEVAARLHIDRSTVAKWETGISFPRPKVLYELSKMYGCTMEDLMKEVPA